MRRSNADRTAETRAALLRAARALFAKKGFAETSTPEIVKGAAVTRGALYHHFTDKADLFRAVFESEAQAVADEILGAISSDLEPLDALLAGAEAYFTAMSAPGRAQIMLLEAPAVLSTEKLQNIDAQTGAGTLLAGLKAAAGSVPPSDMPFEALAEILSAAFDRAALAIANGAPPEPYRLAIEHILVHLFRNI